VLFRGEREGAVVVAGTHEPEEEVRVRRLADLDGPVPFGPIGSVLPVGTRCGTPLGWRRSWAGPEGAAEGEEREAALKASPSEALSEPEAGATPEDEAPPERPPEEEEEAEAGADLFDPWG
jgi:hypothetical protein